MATREEAQNVLYEAIAKMAKEPQQTLGLLRLAEAYAYVASPNNSHGGSAHVSSK